MKFCRLKTYLCLSAQVVIILFLILLFRNPRQEQVYPRRHQEDTSLTIKDLNIESQDVANRYSTQKDDFEVENNPQDVFRPQNPPMVFKQILSKTSANKKTIPTAKSALKPNFKLKLRPSSQSHRTQTSTTNATTRRGPSVKYSRTVQERGILLKISSTGVQSKVFTAKIRNSSAIMVHTQRKPLKIEYFTAEPHWIFGDDYTLDTSSMQTSCPISVKIKALNSSWLKELFLPQVVIFMEKHHFDKQEWDRLGHFIPPFGWMELNYTVVKEVVSVLPHLPDQQILLSAQKSESPRCISCAVVGNGGILNGSRLGKEIDSHDYVFRVNGAVIQGFEKDVGTRTSFYGFTAFTMLSSLYLLTEKGFSSIPKDKETKYILYTEGSRDYEWLKALQQNKEISRGILENYRLRPQDDFGNSFDPKKLLVAHPDFVRYLKNRFLRSDVLDGKNWNLYRPSTGALVLLTAMHLCDTVSAYGFMTDDYMNYSDHYYDQMKIPITFYINHDFLLERDLWRNLHRENIIKLYQRT
ncbi:alpha-N-acetylgalactosaminide alpha-2,6-sialyltransferase 1 [Spea bombifrons]|uniref:alpha-N-acetylgalactosaminide alpha-2,6-sialyltransferase 1 n=1 Tax=Spea bombifrons TaxID=233779 RepID=UPI00234A121A|nr:alpha-N-acetylgalactosaminide alpha-2,6-sialyltransferase 1 [Spea bombifrons]